jgi:glucose-1-phosphate adenylyltransferase
MILAGGQGAGLGVLTRHRPAAAMPFGGKYRVIDFSLSNCVNSEISNVAVLTQYAPTSLNEHIRTGRPWDLDRREGGVRLLQPYARRERLRWYRGTADAIAQNLNVIFDCGAHWVLVLSGDQVYKMDYAELVWAHQKSGCPVTMTVREVSRSEGHRFGIAEVDAGMRLTSYEEKPRQPRGTLANLGVYIFDTEFLLRYLIESDECVDLVADLIEPALDAGVPIHCDQFHGYWDDIGTIDSYFRSNMELLAARPRFNLADPDWRIFTPSEERPPVKVLTGATVERSLVANGAIVRGTVRDSILFPGAVVEQGASVSSSIIMADSHIETGARIDLAILDKQVRVGEGAVIGQDTGADGAGDARRSNIVVIGRQATVPAACHIGRRCVIDIGTRAEDFASDVIEAGSTIGAIGT